MSTNPPLASECERVGPGASAHASRGDPWREVAECAERLAELGALGGDARDDLLHKIASRHFDLVVAGQFKRGKTSLINALLGHELLPTAVVPLTSVITLITYGPEASATIVYRSGASQRIVIQELRDYVTERGNPNNEKGVREADVTYPSRWLADGIRLVDTPGVGSVYRSNTDVAQRFLPKADAVLFVLSVDQPLGLQECEFLRDIRQYADRIFFLLNKADLLSESELRESVEFTRDALRSELGAEPALFAISARVALRERSAGSANTDASGLPQFAEALETFLRRDKNGVLAASIGRRLVRSIADARFAVDVELRSLSESLDALAAKAAQFAEKKRQMLVARDDLDILLGRDAGRALQRPLEEALHAFKMELAARVAALLERRYAELRRLPLRDLRASLEAAAIATIREGFDAWQRKQGDAIDDAFAAFCARHSERVDAIVDELYRFAADLFAVSYTVASDGGFRGMESRFYYKFWSEPPALRILGAALVLALPRALGGPLVARRVQEHARELVDMQAGRLRYDFSRRIDEALLRFNRATGERVDASIAAIESAIGKAMTLRKAGESGARLRRTALQSRLHELARIESVIARFVDGAGAAAPRLRPPSPASIAGDPPG